MSISKPIDLYYHNLYQLIFKAETEDEAKEQYKNIFKLISLSNTTYLNRQKRRTLEKKFLVFDKYIVGQKEYGKENKPHYHMLVWLKESVSRNTLKKLLKDFIPNYSIRVCDVKQTKKDVEEIEKYVCKGKFLTYNAYKSYYVREILARWKPINEYKSKSKETVIQLLKRIAIERKVDFKDKEEVCHFVMEYIHERGMCYDAYRYKSYCASLCLEDPEYRKKEIVKCLEFLSQ